MMVLSLIARDAANCPTYTAPASTAVPNASIDGELGRAELDIDHAVQRGRTFDIESRRWAAALKAAKNAKTDRPALKYWPRLRRMAPALIGGAYRGAGCKGTGYDMACRRFGDRTRGPFAAAH